MKLFDSPPPGGWSLALQVAFAILVTICLCIWQISRGFEKLEDKANFEAKLAQSPTSEAEWLSNPEPFAPFKIKGKLDPSRYFVIENQSYQGRPGYWIIGVLNTDSDRYLVNRGWVSVQGNLRIKPMLEAIVEPVEVSGASWPNEVKRSSRLITDPQWPIHLRELDIGQMARLSGARAEEIRLKCCKPAVFEPAPLQMEYATAIHWGYAAQWIMIGLLVWGGYWFFTIRKDNINRDS